MTVMQVLMHNLHPDLPDALGPAMHGLLRRMWSAEPADRPDVASVLDELDAAEASGPEAFSVAARELVSAACLPP